MLKHVSNRETKTKVGEKTIKEWYNRIKAGASAEHRYVLKWQQFIVFAFLWEVSLFHTVYYLDLTIEFGALILPCYFIFAVGLSVPLTVALMFWGIYTKRGYIRFWDMVPILKGMTWASSLYTIACECLNVSLAALALSYVFDVFYAEMPWGKCKFAGASNKCRPMYPTEPYTKPCCFGNCTRELIANRVHISEYDYFINYKLFGQLSNPKTGSLTIVHTGWAVSIYITWFLIFFLLTIGFQQCQSIINNLIVIMAVLLLIPNVVLLFLMTEKYPKPPIMENDLYNVFSIKFWLDIIGHSFSRKIPSNYISLGSHLASPIPPNKNIYFVYFLKFIAFSCLMIWWSTGLQVVQESYKISDISCIPITGLVTLFVIIPGVLARQLIPQLTLFIYFSGLWFLGFASTLYTTAALYESIVEVFPKIRKMRVFFCAALCATCCFFTIILVTKWYIRVYIMWKRTIVPALGITLVLIFYVGVFLYSVRKYAYDYYFKYGKPLGGFWQHGLKLTGLITFIVVVTAWAKGKIIYFSYPIIDKVTIACYTFAAVILLPIPVVAVWIYIKYQNELRGSFAVNSAETWGPPTLLKKQARNRFAPEREIRYKKDDQRCKHNCLLNARKSRFGSKVTVLRRATTPSIEKN